MPNSLRHLKKSTVPFEVAALRADIHPEYGYPLIRIYKAGEIIAYAKDYRYETIAKRNHVNQSHAAWSIVNKMPKLEYSWQPDPSLPEGYEIKITRSAEGHIRYIRDTTLPKVRDDYQIIDIEIYNYVRLRLTGGMHETLIISASKREFQCLPYEIYISLNEELTQHLSPLLTTTQKVEVPTGPASCCCSPFWNLFSRRRIHPETPSKTPDVIIASIPSSFSLTATPTKTAESSSKRVTFLNHAKPLKEALALTPSDKYAAVLATLSPPKRGPKTAYFEHSDSM